jgi:hypothetical protein
MNKFQREGKNRSRLTPIFSGRLQRCEDRAWVLPSDVFTSLGSNVGVFVRTSPPSKPDIQPGAAKTSAPGYFHGPDDAQNLDLKRVLSAN